MLCNTLKGLPFGCTMPHTNKSHNQMVCQKGQEINDDTMSVRAQATMIELWKPCMQDMKDSYKNANAFRRKADVKTM